MLGGIGKSQGRDDHVVIDFEINGGDALHRVHEADATARVISIGGRRRMQQLRIF